MAYKYAQASSRTTAFFANLWNSTDDPEPMLYWTDQAVKASMVQGITAELIILGMPVYGRACNSEVGGAYCYDEETKYIVSCDTVDMVAQKSEYVECNGLGGGLSWKAAWDQKGDQSLVGTMAGNSTLETTEYCLSYPDNL